MYVEIYQALAVIAFIIVLLVVIKVLVSAYHRKEEEQQSLHDAYRFHRLKAIAEARKDIPEDWDLRGHPDRWETKGPKDEYTCRTQLKFMMVAFELTDEEFAQAVLLALKQRMLLVKDDKVFTRLAGRIFRQVEMNRKLTAKIPTRF